MTTAQFLTLMIMPVGGLVTAAFWLWWIRHEQ